MLWLSYRISCGTAARSFLKIQSDRLSSILGWEETGMGVFYCLREAGQTFPAVCARSHTLIMERLLTRLTYAEDISHHFKEVPTKVTFV